MASVAVTPQVESETTDSSDNLKNAVLPPSNIEEVVKTEIKEWHFHIYFHQKNQAEHAAALALRDAVLRLRRDGAFVAIPLWGVNEYPVGPHPVGSYEIWCPSESFVNVFSYLCQHHGDLSVLIHPLTREERKDHAHRNAWIGAPLPLDLSVLPVYSPVLPLQYPSLGFGYSSSASTPTIEERRAAGAHLEDAIKKEPEAAPAPHD